MDEEPKKGKIRTQNTTQNWRKSFRLEGESVLNISNIPVKRCKTVCKRSTSCNATKVKVTSNESIKKPTSNAVATADQDTAAGHLCHEKEPLSGEICLMEVDPMYTCSSSDNPSSHLNMYTFAISQNQGYVFLEDSMEVCALMDWDYSTKSLMKNNPVIVRNIQQLGLDCSCNTDRSSFMNKVSSCSSADVDKLFPCCIHMEAVDLLVKTLKSQYGSEEQDWCIKGDHSYSGDCSTDGKTKGNFHCLKWGIDDTFAIKDDSHTYGIIGIVNRKLTCLSCQNSCSHVATLEQILDETDFSDEGSYDLFEIYSSIAESTDASKIYSLKSISSNPIPFHLSTQSKAVLIRKPSEMFVEEDGILQIISGESHCPQCGADVKSNQTATKDLSWVITKYNLQKAQCFVQTCSQCNMNIPYDGQEACLLNMGKFLVHYEVMRDYMYQFFNSRCTLSAFYNTLCNHQEDAGNDQFPTCYLYSHFRWSWYSFIRLLDIQYEKAFLCDMPSCGREPEMLLFDGTSLAFQRASLPVITEKAEDDEPVLKSGSRYNDRVFIADKTTRSLLRSFAKSDGILQEELAILRQKVLQHQPCLLPLLPELPLYVEVHGSSHKETKDHKLVRCPPEYKELLVLLTCESPMCATVHFSDLNLILELFELPQESTIPSILMANLQQRIPILFDILSNIGYVPKIFIPIFDAICRKVRSPFVPSSATVESTHHHPGPDTSSPLACYPSLAVVRRRGKYEADRKRASGSCRKTGGKHPSLLPGIFTVFCPHGICYGFEVMITAESPNVPYSFLKTRFEKPPKIIVYDNACNLYEYALNRDPMHFSDTQFLIDRLHWPNHKKCASGYAAHSYPMMRGINTQIVEQNNGKIRKLKSSLSYMKPENFMDTLKLFLWNSNEQVRQKNNNKNKKKSIVGISSHIWITMGPLILT